MERTFMTAAARPGHAVDTSAETASTNKRYSLAEPWEAEAPKTATNAEYSLAEPWEATEDEASPVTKANTPPTQPMQALANATFKQTNLAEDWEK